MTKAIKTTALALFALTSICANAQNGVNSPYSRYGYGIASDRSMGFNKAMGGIAQGYRDGQTINVANPAALSACDSLTALFDFGFSLQNGNYKMGSLQQNAKNTSLDYAAFHFRAKRGLGIAVAVLPVTNIGYNFTSSSEAVAGTENVTSASTFSGEGGLHQVLLGLGWQVAKPLSVGANISYLYGDYSHTMSTSFSQSTASGMTKNYSADISTYSLDLGMQYTQKISKKDRITIGATYNIGHNINSDAYRTITNGTSTATSSNSKIDTLKNAFQLPTSISAGFTYRHTYKLVVGADVTLQKWGEVKFPNQGSEISSGDPFSYSTGLFNDVIKYSGGISYVANPFSKDLSSRIIYKLGGYYSQTYANTAANLGKPHEYGLTAGVSLPISNRNSSWSSPVVHLSFQWVHSDVPYMSLASGRKSTLSENYLKACVGLTISDRWFYKWKVK